MGFAAIAVVVYAGIAGTNASTLDTQVATFLHKEAKATSVQVSSEGRRILARHLPGTEALVRRYHANGLIVGELVHSAHGAVARMVVYDGDGHRKDLVEIPLDGNSLDESGVDVLRSNLLPDVLALDAHPAPEGGSTEVPGAGDVEPPLGGDATAGTAADTPAEPAATGDPAAPAGDAVLTHEEHPTPPLRFAVSAGIGVGTRSFSVDGVALRGYDSDPVPTFGFDVEVYPFSRLVLHAEYQRTLTMNTALPDGNASTTMDRWQAQAGWSFKLGDSFAAIPELGIGDRTFVVDSSDTDRSPDADYMYLWVGGGFTWRAAANVLVGAWLAVEPGIGGTQSTELILGSASRLGFEARLRADLGITSWLFVRGEAFLQSIATSFPSDSGGGSASDLYLGATLMLGAKY